MSKGTSAIVALVSYFFFVMGILSRLGFVIYSMLVAMAFPNFNIEGLVPSILRQEPVCVQLGQNTACRLPQSSRVLALFGNDLSIYQSLRESPTHDVNMLKLRGRGNQSRQVDGNFGGFYAEYYGNFTTNQRHVVDHCMDQASYWCPSRIPVNIIVNFTQMEDSSALGNDQPMSL